MAKIEREKKKPFGGEKFSRFLNIFVRILVAIFVWPFLLPRAYGNRAVPSDKGCLLIANHHSLFDPIFITFFYTSRRLCFIAKKEIYNTKWLGRILQAFGSIPLDRSTSDIQASKAILSEILNKKIVGLFPQGTRVPIDDLTSIEPHSGLIYYSIRREIPIIPVGIDPRYRLFGRPRYMFADSVILKLREGEKLNQAEQAMVAHEVMRRVYALAGLHYARDDSAENEELFNRKIEIQSIESPKNSRKKVPSFASLSTGATM